MKKEKKIKQGNESSKLLYNLIKKLYWQDKDNIFLKL